MHLRPELVFFSLEFDANPSDSEFSEAHFQILQFTFKIFYSSLLNGFSQVFSTRPLLDNSLSFVLLDNQLLNIKVKIKESVKIVDECYGNANFDY